MQCVFVFSVTEFCPTLYGPMGCSPPDSSLSMGFPRQEYWGGLPFPSPGIFPPKDQTRISCIGRRILYHWATWEACTSLLFGCYYHYYLDLNFNLNILRWGTLSLPFTCPVSTTWPMLPMSFVCLPPVGIWAGDEHRPKLGNDWKCFHLFFYSPTNKSFSQASMVTFVELFIIMFNS